MGSNHLNVVIRHLRKLGAKENARKLQDRQLLDRFVTGRDEGAFEALVARHGQMVLNVCRRVLHDPSAIEDAFQATFLVLVRKASSIRKGELLGNWLYGVAYRTAARANVESAKRRARESAAPVRQQPDPLDEISVRELFAALDEQLYRLPSEYRAPLVLCYLESKTRDEAARKLGCSQATLDRRLARGREFLRTRLARQGLTLSVALFPIMLAQGPATACMPSTLVISTVKAAATVAAGGAAAGLVSPKVAALTEGVMRTMFLSKIKAVLVGLLLLGLLGVGAGSWTYPTQAARPAKAQVATELKTDKAKPVEQPMTDKFDDWRLKKVIKAEHEVYSVAWSPKGQTVAAAMWDGVAPGNSAVQLFDAQTGEVKRTLAQLQRKGYFFRNVFFSRDGKIIVTTADGCDPEAGNKTGVVGEVKLWDAETGELKQTLTRDRWIQCAALSGDGKTLVGGSAEAVIIWDTATGAVKRTLNIPNAFKDGAWFVTWSVALSPDGKTLAAANHDEVTLWDVETGTLKRTLSAIVGGVMSVAFSPDGKTLAVGAEEGSLWDAETGLLKHVLKGALEKKVAWISQMSFSPDGRTLAVSTRFHGDKGEGLTLWNVKTGKLERVLEGQDGRVNSAVISSDGRMLVSGSLDRTIRIWKLNQLKKEKQDAPKKVDPLLPNVGAPGAQEKVKDEKKPDEKDRREKELENLRTKLDEAKAESALLKEQVRAVQGVADALEKDLQRRKEARVAPRPDDPRGTADQGKPVDESPRSRLKRLLSDPRWREWKDLEGPTLREEEPMSIEQVVQLTKKSIADATKELQEAKDTKSARAALKRLERSIQSMKFIILFLGDEEYAKALQKARATVPGNRPLP